MRKGKTPTTFEIDATLRSLARKQLGLFTVHQAANAGVERTALARRRDCGALELVFPNVLRLTSTDRSPQQLALAAGLAIPCGAITGPSAAVVYSLPLPRSFSSGPNDEVVAVARSRQTTIQGISVLRESFPAPRRPWFTTKLATPASTILTLPRYVSNDSVERCLDHCLTHDLMAIGDLHLLLEAMPFRAVKGRRLLVDLVKARSEGIGHRSRKEMTIRRWLNEAGLHGWRPNYNVDVGNAQHVEVDFGWTAERVALEVSPFSTHGSREKQERDALRRRLLVSAGWRVIEALDPDLRNQIAFGRISRSLATLLRPANPTEMVE